MTERHAAAKNQCGIIVEFTFTGIPQTLKKGGHWEEVQKVKPGRYLHNVKSKYWVVPEEDTKLSALWITVRPNRTLIHTLQYLEKDEQMSTPTASQRTTSPSK